MQRGIRERTVKRGEIYYADLDGCRGSELFGIRPVLIVQNDIGNCHSPTTIIAPISSRRRHPFPTQIMTDCLRVPSTIHLEQLRTIDKDRLRQFIVRVDPETMVRVDEALKNSLALS